MLLGLPLGQVTPPEDVAEVIAFLAVEERLGFHYRVSAG
jgi:hypothetical protein